MFKLDNKDFTIKDYNNQLPFASFLPGVAGKNGIPMWTYYVNRGQAIAGFGIENKDQPIFDFVPANVAYRRTELNGFRTFIKVDGEVFEMFSSSSESQPEMTIKQNGIKLYENNKDIGVEITVEYFNVTSRDYPGLIRTVKITSEKEVEVLDGLTTIYPRGMNNGAIKDMANLSVAWIDVVDVDGMKLYKNRSTTADTAEMSEVNDGNFYASFNNRGEMYEVVYDLEVIFGKNTSLLHPVMFKRGLDLNAQVFENKLPCAFSYSKGKDIQINTVIGSVDNVDILKKNATDFNGDYIEEMKVLSEEVVKEITSPIESTTNEPLFDAYMSQSYLDNVLRGGYPLVLEGEKDDIVYHIYSRIHGDMEREYNYFVVEPSFYSQGNGNFRDVNQNRRNDVIFVPESGLYNIKTFMDMIQLDGNNPLVVKGSRLTFNQDKFDEIESFKHEGLFELLRSDFSLGELATFIHHNVDGDVDNMLKEIVKRSTQDLSAEYGHGYWVDHWTYNMDLVDNFLKVYPDRFKELMFESKFRFFESPEVVLPRKDKYLLTPNGVRQFGSIKIDEEKIKVMDLVPNGTNWTKVNNKIYETSLYVKLITMMAVKYASLDPSGMGIMMESEKPGWNDAMNGLPGIFGSGVSETVELRRVASLLNKVDKEEILLPKEISHFIEGLIKHNTFDSIQGLKEQYREDVRLGLSGEFVKTSTENLAVFVEMVMNKLDEAVEKATDFGNGIIPTFLSHEAVEYEKTGYESKGYSLVHVSKWNVRALPNYLEAPARMMKQMNNSDAKTLFELVKKTEMFDEKLGMYVTSESLDNESLEIGRARAFTAGWLERESCFMHMEFKYLYGMLKAGLYNEYFEAIQTALPAFMDPAVYGRSPLENSSFIATSRNPNPNNHGRGFVARLTGTSTEAISLWFMMMTGGKLFNFTDELEFEIAPILQNKFFKNGEVKFKLFNRLNITLQNKTGKDTFGANAATVSKYVVNEQVVSEIKGELAYKLREGDITELTVIFE